MITAKMKGTPKKDYSYELSDAQRPTILSGDNKNTNSKGLSLKPILSVLVYANFTLTSIKEINSVEELPPASGPVGKLNGGIFLIKG